MFVRETFEDYLGREFLPSAT